MVILLLISTLGESLKIPAIVTVLSLPFPLDLAPKTRDTFGMPQVQKSIEKSDVFLRK